MVRALQLIGGCGWAMEAGALAAMADIARRSGPWSADSPEVLASKVGERLGSSRSVAVRDGVAVIPVAGPMFRRANLFSMISGATSTEVLARELREAVDNPNVVAVLLAIDSPGGEAAGISELAEQIAGYRKRKPVHAYADGMCCSGAYWIAAACETITASRTAVLGSVGAVLGVCCHADEEHVEFISSQSPLKRADPKTEDGQGEYQQRVDDLAAVFVSDVARFRGVDAQTVLSEFGRGGCLTGARAVRAGLADRTGTEDALLAKLATGKAPQRRERMAAEEVEEREQEAQMDDQVMVGARVAEPAGRVTDEQFAELQERLAQVEARNAALTAAESRREVTEALAGVRLLEGAAVIAPRSREALAEALMTLGAEQRVPVLAAVTGIQCQPVSVAGFADGGEGSSAAAVTLTAGEEALVASEAKRKGLPVADVRAAFVAARESQIADGRFVQR